MVIKSTKFYINDKNMGCKFCDFLGVFDFTSIKNNI